MIRALFEANVLASGLLGLPRPAQSVPGFLMSRWEAKAFQLIVSEEILEETIETLRKPYFRQRLDAAVRRQALIRIRRYATVIDLTISVQGVAPDPDDDHVLAAAVSAEADYLVTGDGGLRVLGSYQGIGIVTPREVSEVLDAS